MKMKSKDKRSIFDISFLLENNQSGVLEDIEFIATGCSQKTGHVLSKNIQLDDLCVQKSDLVELIKSGYNLPAADEPQKMLLDSTVKKEEKLNTKDSEMDSFRMINLVSKNYNLPKVE